MPPKRAVFVDLISSDGEQEQQFESVDVPAARQRFSNLTRQAEAHRTNAVPSARRGAAVRTIPATAGALFEPELDFWMETYQVRNQITVRTGIQHIGKSKRSINGSSS